jgi:AbrB family looped-hinge helix DNA binding protein
MPLSVLTKKWQTTIPKEIRDFLKLKPNDKILYLIEGEKEFLKPVILLCSSRIGYSHFIPMTE